MQMLVRKIEKLRENARQTIGYELGADAEECGFPTANCAADPPKPDDVLAMCDALLAIVRSLELYSPVVAADLAQKIQAAFEE